MYKFVALVMFICCVNVNAVAPVPDERFSLPEPNAADSLLERQSREIALVQKTLDTEFGEFKKPKDLATYAYHASMRVGIQPRLMLNLMAVESSFNPNARSKAGAIGIVQVIPRHHGVTARELRDYRTAINVGAEVIDGYRQSCNGDLRCALHKYNVGPANYAKGKRNNKYVAKLLRGVRV